MSGCGAPRSLLLGVWLLASLLMLPGLDQRTLSEWLRGASGAVPMALFVIVAFKHAARRAEGRRSTIMSMTMATGS